MDPKFSSMVFESAVKGEIGQFSLDGRMLTVLMQLDGKKDLGTICESLGMPSDILKKIITLLYKKKLIKRIQKAIPVIDGEFFDVLRTQLSKAVGPIAEILIEDEVESITDPQNGVPTKRAAELVERLARQVPRPENKILFQKVMIDMIRSKGY